MKKFFSVLLILIMPFLVACGGEDFNEQPTRLNYGSAAEGLFPFFCIDKAGVLWRVENGSAYSLSVSVQYFSGSTELSFLRYFKSSDTLLFAYDISMQNGVALCSLGSLKGNGGIESIADGVRLDSLRATDGGSLIFINADGNLFYRCDGILSQIDERIAQCEFVTDDSFLMRRQEGSYVDGEFQYSIYSYSNGFRNYIADGFDIIASDIDGVAFITKNKHTVQKRASSCIVADCLVCSETDVIFEVPSVVLSRFEEAGAHPFLLTCDESAPTLTYNLFAISGERLTLKASNVLSGEYISQNRDVFKYETVENGSVKTYIIDVSGKTLSFAIPENVSGVYYAGTMYFSADGVLTDSAGNKIAEGVSGISYYDNGLIAYIGSAAPIKVCTVIGNTVTLLADDSAGLGSLFKNGIFYYYTGEKGAYDLVMTDGGVKTALLSSVDTKIGFVADGHTVAAAKYADKSLFIVSDNAIIDTGLKISRFLTELETV